MALATHFLSQTETCRGWFSLEMWSDLDRNFVGERAFAACVLSFVGEEFLPVLILMNFTVDALTKQLYTRPTIKY